MKQNEENKKKQVYIPALSNITGNVKVTKKTQSQFTKTAKETPFSGNISAI